VVDGRAHGQRSGARGGAAAAGSLLVGHERLGRYLVGGDPEGVLARGAVTLTELLGWRPDPAPFREAIAQLFRLRAEAGARPS
jgi:hypothetical protein